MPANKPPRRRLQFRLRSLLLLTLAMALWLGYEVWQARSVQRVSATIQALGGQVQYECVGWSLLRFAEPQKYGLRIVQVHIPAGEVDGATQLLSGLRALREVVVLFDGTCDPNALVARLRPALPRVQISAKAAPIETFANVASDHADRLQRLKARLLTKLRTSPALRGTGFPKDWRRWESWWIQDDDAVLELLQEPVLTPTVLRSEYQVLRMPDGSVGELFALNSESFTLLGSNRAIAILFRHDQAMAWVRIEMNRRFGDYALVVDDIDHDGFTDVGFECDASASDGDGMAAIQFPGDARYWLALYRIDGDQFRSLLPSRQADQGGINFGSRDRN